MGRRPQSIDPRKPLTFTNHEDFAQLIAFGDPETGEKLTAGDCYNRAGHQNKRPAGAASNVLANLKNGVQARIDFLMNKRMKAMARKSIHLEERHLKNTEERKQEVDRKMNSLFDLAVTERPKLTAQGAAMKDEDGNPVREVASLEVAFKIAERMGIDAGMYVRQSRSGKIEDDWSNLCDEEIQNHLVADLAEHGLTVMTIEEKDKLLEVLEVNQKLLAVLEQHGIGIETDEGREPEGTAAAESGEEREPGSVHSVH